MISPKIIKKQYKSGFSAEIVLKPGYNQRFFGIITDFGSSDPQEVAGSAHFLEHKLFAKEDGDISQKFEELGADVNAFTSFNETMFYCSGVKNNPQLINLLFRLVGEPYFTEENVKKEIPIIIQELSMYKDEPNWLINNNLMRQMFGDSELGIDVAGTEESIAATTVEALTKVYQQNYQPKNMHFIACGDFSDYQIKSIFRQVNKLQEQYFKNIAAPIKNKKQTRQLVLKDEILEIDSQSNLFGIGLFLPNFKKVLSSLDLAQILLEIMLESKLGIMSPFFDKMKKKKLLSSSTQISVNYTRQGNFVTISGVSDDAQKVISAIKEEIMRPLDKDDIEYAKSFFELKKREWLAHEIRTMNNISYLAVELAEESLDDENLFENINQLQLINFEKYDSICKDLLKDSAFCSAMLVNKD